MIPLSLWPAKPWLRVRPWTVIILAPASTIAHANAGALRLASFQPARCLTVTGTSAGTARTTARTSAAAISGSRISAEPHSPATTRLAGQPMLMSTTEAPIATAISAAFCIGPSSRPKIWTPKRRPPRDAVILPAVLASPAARAWADRNSVIVRPTPCSSQTVRNGRSVTDAIGASRTGGSTGIVRRASQRRAMYSIWLEVAARTFASTGRTCVRSTRARELHPRAAPPRDS